MQFPSGIEIDRVDEEVGMDVLTVCVGADQNFVSLIVLGQLQRGRVSGDRVDCFAFREALYHVIEQYTVRLVVEPLGGHEIRVDRFRLTVDTCDQLLPLELGLFILHGIPHHGAHASGGLAPLVVCEADDSHTRNGLFFAPLFLLLGAAGRRWNQKLSLAGFFLSLAAMSAEGLWLHRMDVQRHDSMYLALPLCIVCLFSLLLGGNKGESRKVREFSTAMYVLHPLCIVLVRGAAKLLGLGEMLIENSVLHFIVVLALSALLSAPCLLRLQKKPSPTARAWREVDLAALGHNAQVLRNTLAPGTELMAVVKAEAYGHGGAVTARTLQRAGVRAFAVACLAEGIALRKAGIRGTILILGYTSPEEAPLLTRWHLTQTVADIDHGRALAARGRRVHVHLALDTGMHRLGILAENRKEILEAFRLPNLVVDGVFSHLYVSDSLEAEDVAYTQEQLTLFYDTVAWLRTAGYDPGKVHIQSSYGLWNLPAQPCDYVRAGIALYGVRSDDAPVQRSLDLRPVLSLRARVASIRTVQAGESAGYGRVFQAEQETKLAVVTIGYADGLPRDLPQRGGQVLIQGRRCPMVGRMCMDQLLVDVSDLSEVAPDDTVTIIGRDGGQVIRAEELAACCGTITNELLSRLGMRLPIVSG